MLAVNEPILDLKTPTSPSAMKQLMSRYLKKQLKTFSAIAADSICQL
jgi:hypothetical protein